jgi:antitoxin (DNA-binding transcriptional repressor) of toxin-antitoxin stability system
MQVDLQYAEEHFTDLVSAADSGQEVEISRPDKPTLKLIVSKVTTTPVLKDGERILGAGRGELRVPSVDEWKGMDTPVARRTAPRILGAGVGMLRIPSQEEWQAMDKEMEREMLDAPLTTSGEI